MGNKPWPGAKAPELSLPLVGGGTWTLSERMPGSFSMIVVYRGLHCPVCKTYLKKLETKMEEARNLGLDVVAVSMDGEDRASTAKDEWGIPNVPVAYGMTQQDVANWGLYLSTSFKPNESDQFAEPGFFWIKPDGTFYLIDLGNMPWTRPDLDVVIPKAKYAVEENYPVRGNTPV